MNTARNILQNSSTGHAAITIIITIKKLGLNSFGDNLTLGSIVNFQPGNRFRYVSTDFFHIRFKLPLIKTELKNLNLSTHIVIGNTLLVKTQTSLIRVHISAEESIL